MEKIVRRGCKKYLADNYAQIRMERCISSFVDWWIPRKAVAAGEIRKKAPGTFSSRGMSIPKAASAAR